MCRVSVTSAFGVTAALFLAAVGLAGCPPAAPGQPAMSNAACLGCHDGRTAQDMRGFMQGVHAAVSCERCHGSGQLHFRNPELGLIEHPGRLPFPASMNVCADCHSDKFTGHLGTPHATELQLTCYECHDVHRANSMVLASERPAELRKEAFAQLCGQCHEVQVDDFLLSVHAQRDVATCASCHDVHQRRGFTASPVTNNLCQQCHAQFDLITTQHVDIHTGFFHPVDPAGSGASRCIGCHMPPLARGPAGEVPHDHTLFTIPPIFSNQMMDQGVFPAPPNSCSGVAGCHDPNVPGSGVPHDPDSRAQNEAFQALYELIGEIP